MTKELFRVQLCEFLYFALQNHKVISSEVDAVFK
jgi:hypothetical protein